MGEEAKTFTFSFKPEEVESCTISNPFMRIYVAGLVSGEDNPYKKFSEKTLEIKRRFPDAEVINPVAMTSDIAYKCPSFRHEQYMSICTAALAECTHIFLIDDWKHSYGAKEEVMFAIENEIQILTEEDLK